MNIFRSNKNIYAQVIDDVAGVTQQVPLPWIKKFQVEQNRNSAAVGKQLLNVPLKRHQKVVFDRGGYLYHGRVQALAEALVKMD